MLKSSAAVSQTTLKEGKSECLVGRTLLCCVAVAEAAEERDKKD